MDADKSSAVPRSNDDYGDDVKENGGTDAVAAKKVKEKKIKKPKITLAEAAGKIHVSVLAAPLLDVTNLYRAGGTDLDVEACVRDEVIWVRFGEFVVGERSDGLELLKLIDSEKPMIVITRYQKEPTLLLVVRSLCAKEHSDKDPHLCYFRMQGSTEGADDN